MSNNVTLTLQRLSSNCPASLQGYFQEFNTLYEQRLWHQLTERMEAFFAESTAKQVLPEVFSQFISGWHKKMNPLVFVKLAIEASRQMSLPEAAKLMEGIVAEVKQLSKPDGPILMVLASMEVAHYSLRRGDITGTKKTIESCAGVVESFVGVDPLVPATFYRVSADYDKVVSDFTNFYRHALLYLTCVKIDDGMPLGEKQERAHDLCIAALLGDSIYNFGELLAHPILPTLKSTTYAYLQDALFAFNAGDHDAFERLLPPISEHPALSPHLEMLRQKMFLMSLVETVFSQLKSGRTLSFDIISRATRIPHEQVEFLLMKALSLGLIRGTIDEPQQAFLIEWVQPRVLDREQIAELRTGIQAWRERVQSTSSLIFTMLPEALQSVSSAN